MKLWNQTLSLAAMALMAVATAFTASASAQGYDTAFVPFIVNVDASVKAELKEGATVLSQTQISVTAGQEAILPIPLQKTDGIRFFGTQRQLNTPTIISNRNGKIRELSP